MVETLERSVDSKDADTSKAILTTVLNTVSLDSQPINGFNLGVSLVKKKFDGFVGLAKIIAPPDKEVSLESYALVDGKLTLQKDSYRFVMPRVYNLPENISLDKLCQIKPSDVVDLKYYDFNPTEENWCEQFYKDFEADLKGFMFCDGKFVRNYSFVVADIFRTQKVAPVPEKDPARLYILFTDAQIADSKENKQMYLLHCYRPNHDHLKS